MSEKGNSSSLFDGLGTLSGLVQGTATNSKAHSERSQEETLKQALSRTREEEDMNTQALGSAREALARESVLYVLTMYKSVCELAQPVTGESVV